MRSDPDDVIIIVGPPAPGDRGGFPAAFTDFTKLVRALQSQTVILPGPDGCVVGRELGFGTGHYPTGISITQENLMVVPPTLPSPLPAFPQRVSKVPPSVLLSGR